MSEEVVTMLLIPLVLLGLSIVTKVGFENLVSRPIMDRWFVPLKRWQPYLVAAFGIGLAFFSKQVGIELVPDLTEYMTADGDIVTVFAGLVSAVLAMGLHNSIEGTTRFPVG